MELPSLSLLFIPSTDASALCKRLAAAAAEHPLVNEAGLGMPVLLRKPQVSAALRDAATFSTRMFEAGILAGGLASMQGEEHARMRAIYNEFFLPRRVGAYEERFVRPITHEVVDELGTKGSPVDLLDAFAMELPRRVISRLFGFPMDQIQAQDERMRTMFRGIVHIGDPEAAAAAARAYEETLGLISQVVERERSEHSESLLGEILRTLEARDMATVEACQQIVLSLLLGGFETTSWMIANVLHALLVHPDVLARVRDDRSLVPRAIEEGMRWAPSVFGTLRLVERDVELDGVSLHAGMVVHLTGLPSHFDEAEYPSPERFDIDREPIPRPMIFGGGPHYCVGAPLGKMEARVGLELLLERYPRLRAAPDYAPVFCYGVRESVAHGPDRLPVLLS